jgi:hypothetical protein
MIQWNKIAVKGEGCKLSGGSNGRSIMKQVLEEGNYVTVTKEELNKLSRHIKTYSVGSYPVYYLQLHSSLKVQDVLDMRMSDIYMCEEGTVRVKPQIIWDGQIVELTDYGRRELAWYAMQRIKVRNAGEEQLVTNFLCVNKQGKPLQKQVYRKMLERASNELALSRVYNSGYLRSLYGYMEIVHGKKTVDDIAKEYQVERYYLLNRMFKGVEIQYDLSLLDEVAYIGQEGEVCLG